MLKPAKYFVIHMVFELPDGFEGSVPDAMRVAADYWDANPCKGDGKVPLEYPPEWIGNDFAFDAIEAAQQGNGSRLVACTSIHRWTGEGWVAKLALPAKSDLQTVSG